MSKKFIRKSVLEKVRTLSAFDYLNNYHPSLLVKNGKKDYCSVARKMQKCCK